MSTVRRPRWTTLLTVALAAVLLVLALRGTNWPEMLSTVQQAQLGYLGVAGVIGTVAYFARGLRWRILLSPEQIMNPLTAFWATMAGYLGNSFLPARAGELVRAGAVARRYGISGSFVLATAITERFLDAAALVAMGGVAAIVIGGLPEWLVASFGILGLLGGLGFLGLFYVDRWEPLLRALVMRMPTTEALKYRALQYLQDFLLGTRTFQHRDRAAGFAGLTVVVWLFDAFGAILCAWALQLSLSLPHALLLLAVLGLASALPSTPGAVGIFQFVGVSLLPSFGITPSQALTYMIVLQGANYVIVTVLGLLGLWQLSKPVPGQSD